MPGPGLRLLLAQRLVSRARQPGFTLLELLVVLVLLGIIAVLVAPGLGGSLDNAKLKTASRELLGALRVQRSEAITQGKIITLRFVADEASYRVDGELVMLAEGLSVNFQAPAAGATGSGMPGQSLPDIGNHRLAFYPDGSSSGALLQLHLGQGVRAIRIDWLTGEVSLLDSLEAQSLAPSEPL
ncbi:MAG: prepilin-type N-terminal cleavage/methylation domain-containing protein [Gammaproteobacteria bacterium]|nr:prepilin-type N-terminal cleavage/methylation domain-containing protein [Gammaproteobacteria bacterium]MBQ0838747.1 prepilin-type N-terminal cleavage/methylation domain-containing protein [Gammaproteobacteria bacterium]